MRRAALALLLIFPALQCLAAEPKTVGEAIAAALASDPGLEAAERETLGAALTARFGTEASAKLTPARANGIKAASNAVVEGTFDEAPSARIADVAYSAYHAAEAGADPEAAQGIALYGYRKPVGADKISDWAKGYTRMLGSKVAPDIAAELIRNALEKDWSAKTFETLRGSLIGAATKGLDQHEYASYLLTELAKDPKKSPAKIAEQAQNYFKSLKGKKVDIPKYSEALKHGGAKGLEKQILNEALGGLLGGGKPQHHASHPAHSAPKSSPKPSHAPAPKPSHHETPEPSTPRIVKPDGARMAEFWPGLKSSADSYLGTPYVWGGLSHKGIDCSGFTHNSYEENKVVLPRVSRDQWKVGESVAWSDLRHGDLVFFNTLGVGVSHVGMVIDPAAGPSFMQASSSKGVTVSDLSGRYYKQRYLGARRVLRD